MSLLPKRCLRALRQRTAALLAVSLLSGSMVAPALDTGSTLDAAAHIEAPATSAGHTPSHDHLLCAVLASTPSLPGLVQVHSAGVRIAVVAAPATDPAAAPSATFFRDRARAPPLS